MKFDVLTARLVNNGWSLLADEETGINFVNEGAEVEVIVDLDSGFSYLSIGHGMREKDLDDLKKVSFNEKYTTFIFSDGEEWEFEASTDDFDYYYESKRIVKEERSKLEKKRDKKTKIS